VEQETQDFDRGVRAQVYGMTLESGLPPKVDDVVRALSITREEVSAAFERLAAAHVLVLQPTTNEILMAAPFSAVPTPFHVKAGGLSAYGNCIWDALGIPAMLKRDAQIITSCADCGTAAEITVEANAVNGQGVLHFAVPARDWWNDIVFT
jgi:hypothetical protein